MAVVASHCGDRTTFDAFEVCKRPVLITHSNCRVLVNGHPRCKTDEAIRKMAAQDGVIGITGVRMFVKADEPTTIEHVLDHFDRVKKLVEPEFPGIGSDIDLFGYDAMPAKERAALHANYKSAHAFRDKDAGAGFWLYMVQLDYRSSRNSHRDQAFFRTIHVVMQR
jgi:membrane dipeptidase